MAVRGKGVQTRGQALSARLANYYQQTAAVAETKYDITITWL
jgi:hypothetical protein